MSAPHPERPSHAVSITLGASRNRPESLREARDEKWTFEFRISKLFLANVRGALIQPGLK